MTLMAFVVAVTAGAQSFLNEYPWNPDFDNDYHVGTEDLMGLLSVFGSSIEANIPEPCFYDGTPFDSLILGAFTQSLFIDSIHVEFSRTFPISFSLFGCPDLVVDTVEYVFSTLLEADAGSVYSCQSPLELNLYQCSINYQTMDDLPQQGGLSIIHNDGIFTFYFEDDNFNEWWNEIMQEFYLVNGFFPVEHSLDFTNWVASELALPMSVTFDENGISNLFTFPNSSSSVTLLPYWHYAE